MNEGLAGFAFVTYLGGGGDEEGTGIAVHPSGDFVVAGTTKSDDFPVDAS
jgi:hypothetical protein